MDILWNDCGGMNDKHISQHRAKRFRTSFAIHSMFRIKSSVFYQHSIR